jgi:2-methylcitrate dehydratase PrpD
VTDGTATAALVAAALDAYDAETARVAGGRALFDHLACLAAGRRVAPEALGDAGAAALTDRDDLHWPSLTHPGAIVWPVLAATGVGGEQRWRAAHAGYEVTARLGRALGAEHRRYWHATTTAGTIGGAVAAAVALGTDPVHAAGHATSVTGGSILALLERSGTRAVHRDHAAATALRCAQLAHIPATREGLEHPRGLFAAMGGSPDGLGAPAGRSALSETTFRAYATTGFAHALVEAARELAPLDPTAAGTADVVVEAPAAAVALADEPAPRDREAAWWSCQHAVAVSLLGLDLEDGATLDDPRVAELRARIALRESPTGASGVTVDGVRAERTAASELTDDDLVAKWHTLNPGVEPPLALLGTTDRRSP